MARRGTNFTNAVTNQPVCAPARSVLMTSRYATEPAFGATKHT